MKAKQEDVVKQRERQLAKKDAEAQLYAKQQEEKRRKEKMKVIILWNVAFNRIL